MDGVDNGSSEDDLSSDDDTGDPSAAKKKKAALREADRLVLEGIGEEEDDQDMDAGRGKVILIVYCFVAAVSTVHTCNWRRATGMATLSGAMHTMDSVWGAIIV